MTIVRFPVFVVFDGDCPLCHWFVRRLFSGAGAAGFWFVPSGSQAGAMLGQRFRDAALFSRSVVVIAGGKLMAEEEAVCFLLKHMRGSYVFLRPVCALPRWFLKLGYRIVARNRSLFTSYRRCPVPSRLVQQQMVVTAADLIKVETMCANFGP